MEKLEFNITEQIDIPSLVDIKKVKFRDEFIDSPDSMNTIYELYRSDSTVYEEVEMIGGVVVSPSDYEQITTNLKQKNNIYDLCEQMILEYNYKNEYPKETPQFVAIFTRSKTRINDSVFLVSVKNGDIEEIAFPKPLPPSFIAKIINFFKTK